MVKKPLLPLLAAAALAAALPACGEDDTPAVDSTREEQRTDGATGGGNAVQPSQDIRDAVEACKQSVRERTELSQSQKDELEAICEQGGSGDPEDAKAATREACERAVEESVPEGEARDAALETCRTATE